MAIKGSLREASLPDVLQLLAMGQKTGCLSVADRSSFGTIYFSKGRISYASIVNRRDRLGDILVKNGLITQQDLDSAIQLQTRHRDKRLGEILIEQKILTREELHRYIRLQIEEAVYFLFTWTQGTFSFEGDVLPDGRDFLVSITPESLLLEGARRVDEWSLIEKKIPSFDIIFELDRTKLAGSDAELTIEQEQLVPLVDGRRDVAALVDESGLGEFEVGKALYGLATAGFLHRIGKSKASDAVVREARVEEHRNLGIAFYKTGMYEEATREFRRVAELRPNDAQALFYTALVHLRNDRLPQAEESLREAASQPNAPAAVFHNLAFVLERTERLEDAQIALEEAVARGGGGDPRVQTSLGIVALRRGQLEDGDALLASARALFGKRRPSAPWFHYAALAAALSGDFVRAGALVAEALTIHPHVAALHNLNATLLERAGKYRQAAEAAEHGLGDDSGLPQLHKNIGDCHYRAAQYDRALESYERATRLAPGQGHDVWFKIGNIHYKKHDREAALACWEKALELDPENALIRTNLDLVRTVM
jgi:tetratricopeptide (TPR) repeat protein